MPTHPRKDPRAEKRPSASEIVTREASNDGPGLGDPQGKGHGPDRPDQSGSVGQDSKGIMHARVGRTPGIRDARGPRGQREPGKGRHIRDGAGGSPEGRHRLIYCNLGIHGLVWKVFRRFVNGWVVSFQARVGTLAMIANTKTGGQMAADLTRSIDATDDDKIVPTSGSSSQGGGARLHTGCACYYMVGRNQTPGFGCTTHDHTNSTLPRTDILHTSTFAHTLKSGSTLFSF